jgi:hypothetical protein
MKLSFDQPAAAHHSHEPEKEPRFGSHRIVSIRQAIAKELQYKDKPELYRTSRISGLSNGLYFSNGDIHRSS